MKTENNKKNYRKSKQKTRILEILKSTKLHPTADWIYEKLKPEFPSLSLGTIYRNLNILIDQGEILRLDFGHTFDRFDADTSRHGHFICEKCGIVSDLELQPLDNIDEKVFNSHGCKIKHYKIIFYGVCKNCINEII